MFNEKSHFVFSASQRNGIFLLVLIILGLFVGMFCVNQCSSEENLNNSNSKLEAYRSYVDSIRNQKKNTVSKQKIYPFNPNYITDYKGYQLGMAIEEIDRLHQFRNQNKWVNSTKDFQKVTQVSDSLLNKISPYFKFPTWVVEQENKKSKEIKTQLNYKQKSDLNTATIEELETIRGIGEKLSKRIIRYRLKLGGFVNDIQLKDIYGLDYEVEEAILGKFTVKTPPSIEKLDVNKANVIQLTEIPYFNYELAREIVNYRILNEGIKSFEELSKIESFPSHKMDRLKLYLEIN